MVNRLAAIVAVSGVMSGAVAVAAQELSSPRLVLHLLNLAEVPAPVLQTAQTLVEQTFARANVQVEWAPYFGDDSSDAPGVRHLSVILPAAAGADRQSRDVGALGTSARINGRVWVFYHRIVRWAGQNTLDSVALLALVITHEVGHLLLPEYSHANQGIMQPSPPRWLDPFPVFSARQAQTIHRSVADGATASRR